MFICLVVGAGMAISQALPPMATSLLNRVEIAREAVELHDGPEASEAVQDAQGFARELLAGASGGAPYVIRIDDKNDQLDVSSASERLQTAQTAVAAEDWTTASAALQQIEQSVFRNGAENAVPKMMARLNLDLARARALNGDDAQAAAALRSAARSLVVFAAQFPGPQAEEADAISRQILTESAKAADPHEDLPSWIDWWLARIAKWR